VRDASALSQAARLLAEDLDMRRQMALCAQRLARTRFAADRVSRQTLKSMNVEAASFA
jgi:hypothetical protein